MTTNNDPRRVVGAVVNVLRTLPLKLHAVGGTERSRTPKFLLVWSQRYESTRPGAAGAPSSPRLTIWEGWNTSRRS
jgi:hypothetical protein